MGLHTTASPEETARLGQKLATSFKGGEIVAFSGGLGAGKTVFSAGIAQALGIQETVTSPTFAIVNYYEGRIPFAHFDAYRVETLNDLETSGFYDYLEEGAVIAVEWFENIQDMVTEPVIHVDIRPLDEQHREIRIEGVDGF